jgi:hypothetical protein
VGARLRQVNASLPHDYGARLPRPETLGVVSGANRDGRVGHAKGLDLPNLESRDFAELISDAG